VSLYRYIRDAVSCRPASCGIPERKWRRWYPQSRPQGMSLVLHVPQLRYDFIVLHIRWPLLLQFFHNVCVMSSRAVPFLRCFPIIRYNSPCVGSRYRQPTGIYSPRHNSAQILVRVSNPTRECSAVAVPLAGEDNHPWYSRTNSRSRVSVLLTLSLPNVCR
jgi:hypothetical protein